MQKNGKFLQEELQDMKLQKKMSTVVLALLLAFLCAGMSASAAAAAPEPAEFPPDGSVLLDVDGVKVTTAGLDLDPSSGDADPIIWLEVENTGKTDLWLGVDSGSVNGFRADVTLSEYTMENGVCTDTNQAFSLKIPAGSSGRYGLGYYKNSSPGVKMDTLGEMEFCFTLAAEEYEWPYFSSDMVRIVTGEEVEQPDLASLGTVVFDDDWMTLVIGEQAYDDYFGPMVYVYAENKTDEFIGLTADAAEADGTFCDYVLYGDTAAPGKKCATFMAFEGDVQAMKGFENLSVNFSYREAATKDELDMQESVPLYPVSVQYPPQVWGEYENGGLHLEVQPKYNDLITVEVPADDPNGLLFTVSETASLKAGGFDGAGWLFSIAKISADELHQMLCRDMSGAEVFAMGEDGSYYMYYHPTDVRYARETVEKMHEDQDQWSMLCEWASTVRDSLAEKNGLEPVYYGNSEIDMLVARAAWGENTGVTLSTTEFGPVAIEGTDGSPYAELVLQGGFFPTDIKETPDGEYVVLNFPDEGVRVDFFFAPGSYARVVRDERETLYQAALYDDNYSYAEIMQGWYYAAAEREGVLAPDKSLDSFCGSWSEKVAHRGKVTIAKSLAPGKVTIDASWPESAAIEDNWVMVAALSRAGTLVYTNGVWISTEYGENGEGWEINSDWNVNGEFSLNEEGELIWVDSRLDSSVMNVFVKD